MKLRADIDALGGVPSNDFERGSNDAIGKILEMIDASGVTHVVEAARQVADDLTDLIAVGAVEGRGPTIQSLAALQAALQRVGA